MRNTHDINAALSTSSSFDVQTLTAQELDAVAGGLYEAEAACTDGTRSVCHVDGTDDTN